jgi:hypothetical protein
MNLKRFSKQLARLAAAALIVAGVGAGLGAHSVSADEVGNVPHLISVVGDSPTTLKVTWQDRTDNELFFEIVVTKGAGPYTIPGYPDKLPALPGTGSTVTSYVTGLQPQTYYCVMVVAFLTDNSGKSSDTICGTTQAADLGRPIQTRAGSEFCVACPGAGIIGKPSNCSGRRISRGTGTVVLLTWDPISTASFYELRAVSHQDGKTPLDVGAGANDIGAAKAVVTVNGKQLTGFIADGTATFVPGGADYYLKACTAPDQCGGEALVFVPGP